MDTLRGPPFSQHSWILGTPEAPPAGARKQVAKSLLDSIKDRDYDTQTLREILLLIDHECLCRELERKESQGSKDIFQTTIATSAVGDFADHLCSCLVPHINDSSHSERSLQFRALLSVFALLTLHGVKGHHPESHEKRRYEINKRFQEIQWLPGESTELSVEAFHIVQCSHLISMVAAYSTQHFIKAEPKSAVLLDIANNVMQLGVIAVNIALGLGIWDLGPALKSLDDNFGRLVESPDSRYLDLFELQGLTRIATALRFFSRIANSSSENSEHNGALAIWALDCSERVGIVALRQILKVLDFASNKDFEKDIRRPRKSREQISALLDHGPSSLDKYNYFYGLLDCASQLAGIIDHERYPVGFEARMRLIIASSKEASFRWKAIEVLLNNPSSRSRQTRMLLKGMNQDSSTSSQQIQDQAQIEISVISQCLGGGKRQSYSTESMTHSALSVEVMSPTDWIEEPMRISEHSTKAQSLGIPLPRGLLTRLRFSTAGLSTRSSHAYFLNDHTILIYSLSNEGENFGKSPILRQASPKAKYYAAALSEKFLAVLLEESKEHSLRVFRYDGQMVGTDKFGIEADGHQWNPNALIAIHEKVDRTWIAVGGCTKQDGVLSGSIKMYCIDEVGGMASLTKHPFPFNRPKPNPLALDLPKSLGFGPDIDDSYVGRLVCVTNNNRVLVWRILGIALPPRAPFITKREFKRDMRGGLISSAILFSTALSHPYVFCTTCPSFERVINQGEWSFISPVGSASIRVNDSLVHDLTRLRKSGPILLGAVSPQGSVLALVEYRGSNQARLVIMPVISEKAGGLSALEPIVLDEGILAIQDHERTKISPTAVRFHETEKGFCLVAVDIQGKVIKKEF